MNIAVRGDRVKSTVRRRRSPGGPHCLLLHTPPAFMPEAYYVADFNAVTASPGRRSRSDKAVTTLVAAPSTCLARQSERLNLLFCSMLTPGGLAAAAAPTTPRPPSRLNRKPFAHSTAIRTHPILFCLRPIP